MLCHVLVAFPCLVLPRIRPDSGPRGVQHIPQRSAPAPVTQGVQHSELTKSVARPPGVRMAFPNAQKPRYVR